MVKNKQLFIFLPLIAVLVSSPLPKKEVYSQIVDTVPHADPEIKARLDSVNLEDVHLTRSIKTVQLRQKQVAQELQEEVRTMEAKTEEAPQQKPNLWQRIFGKNKLKTENKSE